MAIILGINDIKYKHNGKFVKDITITFRKKVEIPNGVSTFKLSQLDNIKVIPHKNKFICYCDGFNSFDNKVIRTTTKQQISNNKEIETSFIEELEDVELEFDNLKTEEKHDLLEEREEYYQKEKRRWVLARSNEERLKGAVLGEYDCDNEYCIDRISKELPGFMLVDQSTFFYKQSYPTLEALKIENRLKKRFSQDQDLYGTYTRIVLLESHNNNKYDYVESIVIFNYLFKFEVIAIVDGLNKEIYV